MKNKIPCGGFYLDDTLNVNDSGELSIKGGTPYQQLVTDGDGNAKWEDRLAYVVTEEQVTFSQENIAFVERNGMYISSEDIIPTTDINVGANYRVNFDGEAYNCVAYAPAAGRILIGNGLLLGLGVDTAEPFLIEYSSASSKIVVGTLLTNPTHTVSVTRVVETVHKIPQKWLPEKTKVYVSSGNEYMYFDSERTKKLSVEDFISAVNSGGIDFMDLSDYQTEKHPQLVNYQINKNTGWLTAFIAYPNSDGTALSILGRGAKPASVGS